MKNKILLYNLLFLFVCSSFLFSKDLDEIRKSGELRHIGVPYANFITGLGDGLDVELIKGFSKHLGLKYKHIPSTWSTIFNDLTGKDENNNDVLIKGDLIANGLTILDSRKEKVNFSIPTFPSAVWLIARADSSLIPIKPTNSTKNDISLVKKTLDGKTVLAIEDTCLDPKLYSMSTTSNAKIVLRDNRKFDLIDLIPALINKEADSTLLDVPDALIALNKWPGEIKVIGPISNSQTMGVAFRKESSELLDEFNKYLKKIKDDGSYNKMVLKYYPDVFQYYKKFFE